MATLAKLRASYATALHYGNQFVPSTKTALQREIAAVSGVWPDLRGRELLKVADELLEKERAVGS